MKRIYFLVMIMSLGLLSFSFYGGNGDNPTPRTYVGSQTCVCHIPSGLVDNWANTLHGKAQMTPGPGSVVSTWNGTTLSMGSAYGNATVTLSIVGNIYKATLNPVSGSPITYDVAQTRGSGWKQYYHVKINNSYYRLPFVWTNKSYKVPTGGTFSASGQGSWFTAAGALQPVATNTFRKTSWDKGCSGCHTTGNRISLVVNGADSNWVASWANNSDTINAKIGCESCHGPGSDHIADPQTSNIFGPTQMGAAGLQRQQEVCAQCHFRGTSTNFTYPWSWKESADSAYQAGLVLSNYVKTPWQNYINVTGGPQLWPDSTSSRADRTESQEITFSAHYTNLNCYACHDPHVATSFGHQLRNNAEDNSLCIGCHTNFGTPGNPNITAITSHTKHFYDPENQYQTGGASRCITCHMTKVATNISNYDIPTHSFKVIRPIKTLLKLGIVLGTNTGNLNSCAASCHRNPNTAAGTSNVPSLGVGYDSNFTNWSERTDSLLADTLNKWFNHQSWTVIGITPISGEVPQKFTLGQNYPNPFNPSTKFNFSVPKTASVVIKIYDIVGREVYTIVNQKLNPGTYVVDWNSINNYGEYVASGVYFYKLSVKDPSSGTGESYVESKKMILLR